MLEMPGWLQTIGLALPTSWATHGLAAMTWRGLPLQSASVPTLILLAFAVVAGVIGARRFRWEGVTAGRS